MRFILNLASTDNPSAIGMLRDLIPLGTSKAVMEKVVSSLTSRVDHNC